MVIISFASWGLRNARMAAEKTIVASFYNCVGNINPRDWRPITMAPDRRDTPQLTAVDEHT